LKRVIIFSSSEGLDLAKAIQRNINGAEFICKLWSNNFFELSSTTLENLENLNEKFDFALILITPDDYSVVRGKKYVVPRDNVIFELGICIGSMGVKKTFIINPKDIKLPSDLFGLTTCTYSLHSDLDAVAGTICSRIEANIKQDIGVTMPFERMLSWREYTELVQEFINRLKRSSDGTRGFPFDILVGVNREGLLVSEIVGRAFGQNVPIVCLFADRRSGNGVFDSDDCIINNLDVVKILSNPKIRNILVVESITREGITIDRAKKYLTQHLGQEKTIKSATLLSDKSFAINKDIDYIMKFEKTKTLGLPFNIFD